MNKRDELAHKFVHDCPKYSGYPEHIITFKAGWDARDEEISQLREALEESRKLASRCAAAAGKAKKEIAWLRERLKTAEEHFIFIMKRGQGNGGVVFTTTQTLRDIAKAALKQLRNEKSEPTPSVNDDEGRSK